MVLSASLLLFLAGPPVVTITRATQLQDQLGSAVTAYSLSADNLFEALHQMASDFEVPMGIEWVRSADTQRKVDLSWRNATIRQMIDDVITWYRGYDVQLANGILNVFPERFNADRRNILNLPIRAFEVRDEPLGVATWKLHWAVHAILRPSPPGAPGTGVAASIAYGAGGDRRVSVKTGRTNIREVLNRLAVSSSRTVWVVTYAAEDKPTDPLRPTVLLTGDPVPEDQQPVWSFIPWGLDVLRSGVEDQRINRSAWSFITQIRIVAEALPAFRPTHPFAIA